MCAAAAATVLSEQQSCIHPALRESIAKEVRGGLSRSGQKTLSPWLFYDAAGSDLFEQITVLPEYYPTRTERGIFQQHAEAIISAASSNSPLTILELGAGTATKTGILLEETVRQQGSVVYQPVDVSPTALDEARTTLERDIPGVIVEPQVANYTCEPLQRSSVSGRTMAMYIGSSIGNFAPPEARNILARLASELKPGDTLLLGTDLVKDENILLDAYNDAAGVTAAFNLNVLTRLNRDLGADFDLSAFRHMAIWNARESRIEMHLQSLRRQSVCFPNLCKQGRDLVIQLESGETIHTENSYKFTPASIAGLFLSAGFIPQKQWNDEKNWFAVTLAGLV